MIHSQQSIGGLRLTGIKQTWNPCPAATIETALSRGEGKLTADGAFLALTTPFTGRSPQDKFVVKEPGSEGQIWWGQVNRPLEPAQYKLLLADMEAYLNTQELFVRDLYVCADRAHRLKMRLISESAWHTLFAHDVFIRPVAEELADFQPDLTILHAPEFHPDPVRHGTRRPTSGPTAAIVLNFATHTLLIAGTRYAGEIKKSVFSVLNYLLPLKGVLSMHCSANSGPKGDAALFFGLSGTGKTTLSSDPSRALIGDDEHGWSRDGIFNFEGGCYAKCIRLSPETEPEIYSAAGRFGSVVENVVMNPETRRLDFNSEAITENTRVAYPIHFIRNHVASGLGEHPRNILFLSADALGVLPPVSRLRPAQAVYYFLSGYTAKAAGTERDVTEPQPTFSACFGLVFMVHHPTLYAEMLGRLIAEHKTKVWLLNTGWSGGPYGVGARMKLATTRAIVRAILDGSLAKAKTGPDPVFGLGIPLRVRGVPARVLKPRNTWPDKAAYDAKARELAQKFAQNFQQFADKVAPEVVAAGPKV